MRLLIVFPTRGRVKLFFETLYNILDTIGTDNYEIIVNADRDDHQMIDAKLEYPGVTLFYNEPISKVAACNANIGKVEKWDWLLLMSDDMKFVVNNWYDKMIADIKSVWGNSLDFFAHFSDGFVHDKLPTMNICGRNYYERFGYIYHPSYGSMSCDAENYYVSQMLGRHHYFPQVYFNHIHPSNLRFVSDGTYRGNDKFGKHDTQNYFERMKHYFYVENPVFIPEQLKQEIAKLK